MLDLYLERALPKSIDHKLLPSQPRSLIEFSSRDQRRNQALLLISHISKHFLTSLIIKKLLKPKQKVTSHHNKCFKVKKFNHVKLLQTKDLSSSHEDVQANSRSQLPY